MNKVVTISNYLNKIYSRSQFKLFFQLTLAMLITSTGMASSAAASHRLPSHVDNTTKKFMPPVIKQKHESCGQASGIYYVFSYELNCLLNRPASNDSRRFPTHFSYNFLNSGKNMGTLDVAGWRAAKAIGVPPMTAYKGLTSDLSVWPSGYDLYYQALKQRVKTYRYIDLRHAKGINELRGWLYNHLDSDHKHGGVATFRAGMRKAKYQKIPAGQPEAGKPLITSFTLAGGHFMTIAGYNDKVGWDFNGDGKITNNKDITGDGRVDVRDWERGAFLIYNSWGRKWGKSGRAYFPYRLCALPSKNGGIFYNRAGVITVRTSEPRLTVRLKFSFSNRKNLRVKLAAGISPIKEKAELTFQPRMFSQFWGVGNFPMRGRHDKRPIEICIDASMFEQYLRDNFDANIFIIMDRIPNTTGSGELLEADWVVHYPNGSAKRIPFPRKRQTIGGKKAAVLTLTNKHWKLPPEK